MFNPFVYYFFPSSELMALESRLMPFFRAPNVSRFLRRLKTLPNSSLPGCVLRFLCCLGHIAWFLLIVTFKGKFFRLTLSYLATKDCPFGRVTPFGAILRLNNILSLYILGTFASPTTTKYFFYNLATYSR